MFFYDLKGNLLVSLFRDSSQSILLARKVIIIDAQQISAISSGAASL